MRFIRRIPIAMSALALGTATLGNLLASYSPNLRLACGILAGVLTALIVLRCALDSAGVRKELENPAALAVLPALFMALMQLAVYIKPLVGAPALWLWAGALALQLVAVALFVRKFVRLSKLSTVLPAWFLVFVGYVVASVTSPAFSMEPLGRVLLYAGLVGYAVVIPLVAYRVFKLNDLPGPLLPTVAIFAAPPSLCLVGYLAVSEVKQPAVVYVLLALSTASVLYAALRLPKILQLGFHPSYSALTFPFVISAVALKQSDAFLASTASGSPIPSVVVLAMSVFAAVLVLYVLLRYTAYLLAPAEN